MEGLCAKCGSEDINYKAMYPEDANIVYPYVCEECGHEGKEYYLATYQETV